MAQRPSVAVVGGGITGLVAALRLAEHCDVLLIEGAAQVGGKLRSEQMSGATIDVGAEAFLSRRPEVPKLLAELGLGYSAPVAGSPGVLIDGRLKELPKGTVLGIPTSLAELRRSGVLSGPGLIRAGLDRLLPPIKLVSDLSVGELVRTRVGPEVLERIVDPLLGGVYAASGDALSLEVAAPMIAGAMREPRRLMDAAASVSPAPSAAPAPVFGSVDGTMGALPFALRERLATMGVEIRTGAPVTELVPSGARWRITIGSERAGADHVEVDGVLLACPAAPAAKLLTGPSQLATADLEQIPYANVAIVSLAYDQADLPDLERSGYLIPAAPQRWVKAVTMTTEKWGADRYSTPHRLLRASVGRLGESAALQLSDDQLIDRVVVEISPVLRAAGGPAEARVTRWGGALPQYAPGHLGRAERVRANLPARIRLAGAALDGVGIPACIKSADEQAQNLLRDLGHERRD